MQFIVYKTVLNKVDQKKKKAWSSLYKKISNIHC